jgi:transposase
MVEVRLAAMTAKYLPYEPQQMLLLPEALQDWLPEGHLAHFISDTVDTLDLSAFHARYDKDGPRNQPFHPAMMVKVLVYGYATGVFSSRKIARKLHEDVAFRVLAAGNFPAHRTIREFRAFHLLELSQLFVQVVRLAREMGLVKLGTIAVDGTKLKANASRHKAMSYGHMLRAEAELKAQIEVLLKRAQEADEAENNEPELDVPAEIARREARLQAITEARRRLEQRQREAEFERGRDPDDKPRGGRYKRAFGVPEDKAQDNFTDPDSRIMKRAGGGFDASYNAQTAVDEAAHIIVAAESTNNASDAGELPTMLQAVKNSLGVLPRAGVGRHRLQGRGGVRATRWQRLRARGGRGSRGQAAAALRPRTITVHRGDGRQAADRPRTRGIPAPQVDRRAAQRLDQERAGVPAVQSARAAPRARRVELVCMALNLRRMATMQLR